MSEKFEVPKKEKQKLDPQELLKKMTTIPETTGILRRTLSKETVETFLQIITSPEAVEADWMINCGDITEDQAEQYKIATGDYYTCLQKLTDLAIKISQDLKPRFIELVKNDIRGIKQGGLINFFKYLEALINIGAKLYSNENPHISNRGLPTQFYCQLQALIGADLIELSMDEKNEKSIRVEITNLIRELGDVYDETIGSTYPGIFFHIEKSNCIKAFEKKDNLASLDKLLNFTGSYSEEERLRVDKVLEIRALFTIL